MKKEKLLALLGEMDDEWILEAMQPAPGRRGRAASLDGMGRIADEECKARSAAKMEDPHGRRAETADGERRGCAAAADGERQGCAAMGDGEYRASAAAKDGARRDRMASGVGQGASAAKVSGAHHGRRVRTALLAAVLLLALAGAAMAAARSGLLDALFARARIEPNPAAREALVVNDAGAATDGYGYEIAESLRDGRTLYLNVSAENERGETLIFYGPFLTGGILPLDEPCGMVLGGEAAQRADDQLRYALPEDAPDDLSATATVYVLRPKARMIDTDDSSEVNVQGEPLILWEKNESRLDGWYDGYLREKDGSEQLGGEGFTFGGMRTGFSFDDALTKELAEAEGDGEAMVRLLCEHGYVEKLDALSFPVSFRDGSVAIEYAAAQPEAELSDGSVNFLRLSVESRGEPAGIRADSKRRTPRSAHVRALCGRRAHLGRDLRPAPALQLGGRRLFLRTHRRARLLRHMDEPRRPARENPAGSHGKPRRGAPGRSRRLACAGGGMI